MRFPKPVRLSDCCTRWRLSDLERYEAEKAGVGKLPKRRAEDETFLSVKQVAERYNASVSTVWRWCAGGRAA